MRIFFILFTLISILSVYPLAVSYNSLSNKSSGTSRAGGLIVINEDSKLYRTSGVVRGGYPRIATPKESGKIEKAREGEIGIKDLGPASSLYKSDGIPKVDSSNKKAGSEEFLVPRIQNNFNVGTGKMTTMAKEKGMSTMHRYKDGEYLGILANAYYGYVQTEVFIFDDKISDIKLLRSPDSSRNSRYISRQAIPYLREEMLKSQSNNVDIVSGATYTSGAFMESVGSALSNALN